MLAAYPALRIEWCQVRARAMRWAEEVLMLWEEMRRVLAYFLWHAGWWSELAVINRHGLSNVSQEGVAAYAYKQAHHWMALCSKFNLLWWDSPELASMGVGADNNILDLQLAANCSLMDLLSLTGSSAIE